MSAVIYIDTYRRRETLLELTRLERDRLALCVAMTDWRQAWLAATALYWLQWRLHCTRIGYWQEMPDGWREGAVRKVQMAIQHQHGKIPACE